jgi:hypothetical protein
MQRPFIFPFVTHCPRPAGDVFASEGRLSPVDADTGGADVLSVLKRESPRSREGTKSGII